MSENKPGRKAKEYKKWVEYEGVREPVPLDFTTPEDVVQFTKDPEKKIAWITFNRPNHLNAIPLFCFRRVQDLVMQCERDDDVKVIIFKGSGPCFGSGAEAETTIGYYIGYGDGLSEEGKERPSQRRRLYADRDTSWGPRSFVSTVLNCLKATIAQVHGYCYGGHFELAMSCDIVICSEDVLFTHPVYRYLGAEGHIGPLIDMMGIKRVKELMLTGRPFGALEAERYGMANKVVPTYKELEQEVMKYAQAIAVNAMDSIVIGKALFEAHQAARGYGTSETIAALGHTWISNLKMLPGEWNFIINRRDEGHTNAFAKRDMMVAPEFRMSRKRRALK